MIRCRLTLVLLFGSILIGVSQDDCRKYSTQDRLGACDLYNTSFNYFELSTEYYDILNKSILADTSYPLPYAALANSYSRIGDMVKWHIQIEKAIQQDSSYMVDRAYDKFYYFADYQGALEDLNWLQVHRPKLWKRRKDEYYNLQFLKALCYRGQGDIQKAIDEMEDLLYSEAYWPMTFDILHFGRLLILDAQYEHALEVLTVHEQNFGLAETQYYLAQVYLSKGDKFMMEYHLDRCRKMYDKKEYVSHPDVTLMDQISMKDIQYLELLAESL